MLSYLRPQILLGLCLYFLSNSIFASKLQIAWEADVRTIDPRHAVDANSQYLEDLVHCSLVSFDRKGLTQAQLATKLPTWVDETTIDVEIKKTAFFSDGTQLTAKDVVATYLSLKENPSFGRGLAFKQIKNITQTSEFSLRFQLESPDASFINNLVLGILPKSHIEKDPIDLTTPSCGAFRIKSRNASSIVLNKNPFYKLEEKPKIDELVFKIVQSENTRFSKLRANEIDLAQNNINRDLISDIARRYPELQVISSSALKTSYIGFNLNDPLAGNLAIRKAIDLSIDRQAIIDLLLAKLAKPARSLLTPDSQYFNKELAQVKIDRTKAEQILDDAGFKKKGKYRFEISYKTTIDTTRINIARAIASQLKKIGIQVRIEPMEWGRFKQDVSLGRVQMWGLTWIGFKDPDIFRYAFSSKAFPPDGANRGRYKNTKLDALLEEGRRTPEASKRKKIYDQVQEIIAQERPYVFLWHEENFAIAHKKLKNFHLYADGRLSALKYAQVE